MNHSSALKAESPLATARPWPAWLLSALVLGSLLLVAGWRLSGAPITEPAAPVLWQRSLLFEDRPNGDIAVMDAATRQQIASFQGEQGFVRGTLRALARERMRRDLGPEPAFELIGHVDGRLTLRDPATGAQIALESFGPTNAALFARLQSATPVNAMNATGVKS
jgi:putative photosynthetic complex assembly protein